MPDTSLVAIGAAACAFAAFLWRKETKTHHEHVAWCDAHTKADGVVSRISLRGHHSRNPPGFDDHGWSVPVVRFRAANGVEYEVDASDSHHKEGTPLEVAYDPALPSGGRVVARTKKIGCAGVLLAIGVFLIVWGALH
jgi:hypothetical protein